MLPELSTTKATSAIQTETCNTSKNDDVANNAFEICGSVHLSSIIHMLKQQRFNDQCRLHYDEYVINILKIEWTTWKLRFVMWFGAMLYRFTIKQAIQLVDFRKFQLTAETYCSPNILECSASACPF